MLVKMQRVICAQSVNLAGRALGVQSVNSLAAHDGAQRSCRPEVSIIDHGRCCKSAQQAPQFSFSPCWVSVGRSSRRFLFCLLDVSLYLLFYSILSNQLILTLHLIPQLSVNANITSHQAQVTCFLVEVSQNCSTFRLSIS